MPDSVAYIARLWVAAALLAACGGGELGAKWRGGPPAAPDGLDAIDCIDEDHDGAGVGADCSAEDCDDTDPTTIAECGQDCDAVPGRRGCPCQAGAVQPCYRGPDGSAAQGSCAAGLQRCQDGGWGTCDGQVLPAEELCNGADDDCDGVPDENVTNACGDCSASCASECLGVGCPGGFDAAQAQGVVLEDGGGLTLSGETGIANPVIWVANSAEGTVSKVDTRTRVELGRYRTGPAAYPDPSRSTVNPHGDVVSVNRSEGSATRILASDCRDQNGDGLHTSSGAGDILAWGQDDCVVWHLEGMPGARGSAVEIRGVLDGGVHEYVWVGAYFEGIIYEIDAEAGVFTGRQIAGVSPYGAALGPGGYLWTFAATWRALARIDTTTLERTDFDFPNTEWPYGITVDADGRVWIGGSVARFDPESGQWETPPQQVSGGGIAVDGNGDAFVGEFGSAWHVDGETMQATAIPGAGGHGWAVDFDGFAWSIAWGWAMGGGGNATVVDPATDAVVATVGGFVGPYTYSDMTGFQLVNATNPLGRFPHVFEACDGELARWAQITCDVDTPAGSAVSFRVRRGDSAESLTAASWIEVGSVPPAACPLDLTPVFAGAGLTEQDARSALLEVEATLTSADRQSRPVLRSMGVSHSCDDLFF